MKDSSAEAGLASEEAQVNFTGSELIPELPLPGLGRLAHLSLL